MNCISLRYLYTLVPSVHVLGPFHRVKILKFITPLEKSNEERGILLFIDF
jgi:hypothetical protein